MITEKNSHSNHLIIVIDVISRYRFFFGEGGGNNHVYFI